MKTLEGLHSSIERLLLGNKDLFGTMNLSYEVEYGLKHSKALLNSDTEYDDLMILESKLRLVMHYCPMEAFNIKSSDPGVRWKVIAKFLIDNNLKKHSDLIEPLAREIAGVLDLWDISRKSVTAHRDELFKDQNRKCNHCHLEYPSNWKKGLDGFSKFEKDPFKPYTEPIDYQPEVDHIEPVSSLGHNEKDNLHLLCRLCNQGKKEDFGIRARDEMEYAGKEISEIKKSFKWKMFYYVIKRANNKCEICKKEDKKELTIRKIRDDGAYIRTNLRAVCYDCISKLCK